MTSQTTTSLRCIKKRPTADAFTLTELIIVLVIISAMVAVAVPHATRSNNGLKLEQACGDMVEAVKYAMNYTMDTKTRSRLVIDCTAGSYVIEAATGVHEQDFEPLEDSRAMSRPLAPGVHIVDFEGLTASQKNRYCLVFDPGLAWPHAYISLATKDTLKTIRIAGRGVGIEDHSD